jgi:hypothetical protein
MSGKPRDRLNCKNEEEWVKFAKKWWDIRERVTTGVTVKIPFTVTAVPSLSVSVPTGANLNSTQPGRLQNQPAPSATQRQRQTNADRVPLDRATGGDITRQLVDRWKCQVRNCKNHGYTCWPSDDGHIKMDSRFLLKWVEAIQNNGESVDTPPGILLYRLFKEKD